ncbi:IclR family transcriptional regulator [Aureimonas pseudogalii]|uniref:DNA-binding IclR family transcriptional regulator n=1 Tax=Aureimonas pseudogalii TaxID=1744844 RepID=A0A7W6MMD8_9HYPH|nr:IclR family transcriptional regulator [Aureimonas pseudogalii]MBB4000735.1 DNA-binding IclR family transcriptional regulator [Aureimonas pseudogalii]
MPGNANGVAAVERAVSLLEAFTERDGSLSLGELSRRTELDKATVLRIARSLAKSSMLLRNEDASWRLGPKLVRLGAIYQSTFRPAAIVEPLLAELSDRTKESAALYVREGDKRVCLFRHDSPQSIRHAARVGDAFPLDRGAPGRVILAFDGDAEPLAAEILARGWHCTRGERDPQIASLAAPVFRDGRKLFGALGLTGPPSRFTGDLVAEHLPILLEGAARLSVAMGGHPEPE